jgi:hypothetical protein
MLKHAENINEIMIILRSFTLHVNFGSVAPSSESAVPRRDFFPRALTVSAAATHALIASFQMLRYVRFTATPMNRSRFPRMPRGRRFFLPAYSYTLFK